VVGAALRLLFAVGVVVVVDFIAFRASRVGRLLFLFVGGAGLPGAMVSGDERTAAMVSGDERTALTVSGDETTELHSSLALDGSGLVLGCLLPHFCMWSAILSHLELGCAGVLYLKSAMG